MRLMPRLRRRHAPPEPAPPPQCAATGKSGGRCKLPPAPDGGDLCVLHRTLRTMRPA